MSALPLLVLVAIPDRLPLRRQLALVRQLDALGADAAILPGGSLGAPDAILTASASRVGTHRIGLVARVSPWQQSPFHLARALGTLDALSAGRAGWYISETPTGTWASDDSGRWFAQPSMSADEGRAAFEDYVRACRALWSTWDADALIADVSSGQYVDPSRVRPAHYRGEYFSTRGPLNMPRSPQGEPVLVADFAGPLAASHLARIIVVDDPRDVSRVHHRGAVAVRRTRGAALPADTDAGEGVLFEDLSDADLGALVYEVLPRLRPDPRLGGSLGERLTAMSRAQPTSAEEGAS